MAERWTRDSWRKKPIVQVPDYPDRAALENVERQLASYPPLVFAGEARRLKAALAQAAEGKGSFVSPTTEHYLNRVLKAPPYKVLVLVGTLAAGIAGAMLGIGR